METRPLEEFDIHEVNRLIQREQIPGFKLLPREERYLAEYREVLRQRYGDGKGLPNENKIPITSMETPSEVEVEIKTSRDIDAGVEETVGETEQPEPKKTKKTTRKKKSTKKA